MQANLPASSLSNIAPTHALRISESVSNVTHSKWTLVAAIVTSLVLGLIGGFALHGLQFPSGVFGGFGEQMGELGASLTTGAAILIFVMTLVGLYFNRKKNGQNATEPPTPRSFDTSHNSADLKPELAHPSQVLPTSKSLPPLSHLGLSASASPQAAPSVRALPLSNGEKLDYRGRVGSDGRERFEYL